MTAATCTAPEGTYIDAKGQRWPYAELPPLAMWLVLPSRTAVTLRRRWSGTILRRDVKRLYAIHTEEELQRELSRRAASTLVFAGFQQGTGPDAVVHQVWEVGP